MFLSMLFFVFSSVFAEERYQSYVELSRVEQEGIDYRVRVVDRQAPLTVLVIHGGKIEVGTTELAEKIAGSSHNFYTFEGTKAEKAGDVGLRPRRNLLVHLTSHLFDEPRAVELVTRRSPVNHSKVCLSIHGFFEDPHSKIACIGGGNSNLRTKIAERLAHDFSKSDFKIEAPCRRFEGRHPQNIVNRCENQGVQIEFSHQVRRRILENPIFAAKLAHSIEVASTDFLEQAEN